MLPRVLPPLVLLASLARALPGQAPRITPAGDPSVRADSVYRLAVNPADHPEEATVVLLDDGVLRLDADGRGTRTFRQIVQVLKPDVVEQLSEQAFSYAPQHQRFTLNWIRVVKPDGTVISSEPAHVQESDVPADLGDPVYSDSKVVRVSLAGVAPGTIIDWSATTEELKPFLPGDFLEHWSVNSGSAVIRSRYIVDVPASLTPRIEERNLNFARHDTTVDGRRVYTWATRDVPRVLGEPFAADSNGVVMTVTVGSPMTWAQIGKWYADNARSRYVVTPEVEAKVAAILVGAKSLDDTIQAVHRWVAQDVRYVSIALGLGGYQPRTPADVVRDGFGDCKDKATLFVAVMNRLHFTAFPVILNSAGKVMRTLPSIDQFDHAIAAFRRPGASSASAYEFTDLTAAYTPLGELPQAEQGGFALVVHPDGTTEEVTLPRAPAASNQTGRRIVGAISPDGTFDGVVETTATGGTATGLRDAFANPMDSTNRARTANAIASQIFDGADGDSLTAAGGKDLGVPVRLTIRVHHGNAASIAGNNAILTNPFKTMVSFAAAAKQLEALPRRFPIDPEKIFGYGESVLELRVTLPAGWKAQLPQAVTATSAFGTYRADYAQEGRELRITRTIIGASGVQPPDQLSALTAWMRAIAKDDAKVIVIDKSAGAR